MNEDRIVDVVAALAILAIPILRILNIITIPWVWILAPLWLGLGVGTILAIIFIILFVIKGKEIKNEH